MSEHFNISAENGNSSYNESLEKVCLFQGLDSFEDFYYLFNEKSCQKHSSFYILCLCVANTFIFLFGVGGNSLVIYVISCKMSRMTASCMFILNLALADLFVIIFCIPSTLFAGIFSRKLEDMDPGETMCKGVAYAQGAFVFISVYSLVAISFDRFRAVYWPFGITRSLTQREAAKIIAVIWTVGLLIPLPWIFVFQLVKVDVGESGQYHIPFCHEAWSSRNQEIVYFFVVNMFLCYILPLSIIAICNIYIWENVLPRGTDPNQLLMRRVYYLKVFTFLTFLFFLLWLPLYLIMTRVKVFYSRTFHGGPIERSVMFVLIPLSQLLGSCNSCVNPVLYAVLNQTFRKTTSKLLCLDKCTGKPDVPDILLNSRPMHNQQDICAPEQRVMVTESSV